VAGGPEQYCTGSRFCYAWSRARLTTGELQVTSDCLKMVFDFEAE